MLPAPQVLLFDWDNTLVDAWAGIVAALNEVFAQWNLPPWTVQQGRRRRVGPRLALDDDAGPGLEWPGTALPGRPCRSGRRDGAAYSACYAARERQYLVKRLWNEFDSSPAGGTASQDPDPRTRTRDFRAAGREKLCTLEQK